ncbi:MAG: hypothetical protein J4F30_01200, partial [Acidobacteria bacterium]|nr:hypothetical protein [Acidobacteriota bacterium]
AAYIFLRNIEHGLQVAEGQQTHSLSGTERGLRALARRLGFDELATLESVLDGHRDRVHAVYARLFEEQADDGNVAGREFFRLLAGEMNDDDARALLLSAGFAEPESALNAMRALDAAAKGGRSSTRNLLANLLGTVTSGEAPLSAPGNVLIRLERVVAASGAGARCWKTACCANGCSPAWTPAICSQPASRRIRSCSTRLPGACWIPRRSTRTWSRRSTRSSQTAPTFSPGSIRSGA